MVEGWTLIGCCSGGRRREGGLSEGLIGGVLSGSGSPLELAAVQGLGCRRVSGRGAVGVIARSPGGQLTVIA